MATSRPDSSLRNRFFGRDLSIAEGIFPDGLKQKLNSGATEFDDGEYWHLVRLAKRADSYRAYMPIAWVLLAMAYVAGFIILHFGPYQTLVFVVLGYWSVGLWAKVGAIQRLVVPIVAARPRPESSQS